jgi:hypothetical protein
MRGAERPARTVFGSLLAILMRDVTRPGETVFLPPFDYLKSGSGQNKNFDSTFLFMASSLELNLI